MIRPPLDLRILATAALVALGGSIGCSDSHDDGDHDHDALPAECQAIVDACHEKDVGTGRVSECHTLSHDGVAADCAAVEDECVATCEAAPAPSADGGAHHHGGGMGGMDMGGMGGMDMGGMGGMDMGGMGGAGR